MEYHCNDDKVIATKVFELGLKSYHDKSGYVLPYLNFLIQINDVASMSIKNNNANIQTRGRCLNGPFQNFLEKQPDHYSIDSTNMNVTTATQRPFAN